MSDPKNPLIALPPGGSMQDYQTYIHKLESLHGWLSSGLVQNCFLMGEEVGELSGAVRRYLREQDKGDRASAENLEAHRGHVGEEIVDVMNYLLAIANRLDIDLEEAFRQKNLRNQGRSWD